MNDDTEEIAAATAHATADPAPASTFSPASASPRRWVVRHFDDVAPVPCPCGEAKRIGFGEGAPLSVHRVAVRGEARLHVHERLAETYVVLSGEGEIELAGERVAVRAGSVIHIPPGVAHALRGNFDILNLVVPPFDAADERCLE